MPPSSPSPATATRCAPGSSPASATSTPSSIGPSIPTKSSATAPTPGCPLSAPPTWPAGTSPAKFCGFRPATAAFPSTRWWRGHRLDLRRRRQGDPLLRPQTQRKLLWQCPRARPRLLCRADRPQSWVRNRRRARPRPGRRPHRRRGDAPQRHRRRDHLAREGGIPLVQQIEGKPESYPGTIHESVMREGTLNRILFGDPLFAPFHGLRIANPPSS